MIEATKLEYARKLREATGGGKHSVGEVFKTFTTMAACAVSAGRREEEYLKAIEGYEREDLHVLCETFALLVKEMERHPYRDLLGPLYAEVGAKGDRDFRGEFYTPWPVCDFMAAISFGNVQDFADETREHPVEVLEPAAGSGGMVLSFAQHLFHRNIPLSRAHFTLWDVAKVACDMAYANLSLWGVPATVVWGNSLSQEVYGTWRTVHRIHEPDIVSATGQAKNEREGAAGKDRENDGLREPA